MHNKIDPPAGAAAAAAAAAAADVFDMMQSVMGASPHESTS